MNKILDPTASSTRALLGRSGAVMNKVLAGLLIGALAAVAIYGNLYSTVHKELINLRAEVARQNAEAEEKLAQLTRERDDKQARLNWLAREQENKDAEAQNEIDRLAGELADRPVRVRIVTETGPCSGGAGGGGAASADSGAGDAGPAYGLLPEVNSRRLAGALKEVETLSAAYRSCRARLIPEN